MLVRRIMRIVLPLFVIATVAGVWVWMDSRPLLPGISGCGLVRDVGARVECLQDRIEASVDDRGIGRTAREVDDLVADRRIGQECHLGWHPAGERAGRSAARSGRDLPELQSDSWCTQGFDHGFLIGYLDTEGADVTSARMVETCHRIADEGAINCVHAFGHAFARQADGDLDAAWEDCRIDDGASIVADSGRTAEQLHTECVSGAAMERAIRDRRTGSTQVARGDCAGLGAAREFCIEYMPVRASLLGDDRDPGAICESATTDRAERQACTRAALAR